MQDAHMRQPIGAVVYGTRCRDSGHATTPVIGSSNGDGSIEPPLKWGGGVHGTPLR